MGTKLSLNQIKDIDNLPFYFKMADEMDIEDNNVIFNYKQNENMSGTSLGAGFTIQDGDGVSGDVNFNIINVRSLESDNINQSEYNGDEGYNNRGWITQLNDIILSSNSGLTTGFRVVKEKDTLDGGEF
jgi:hypothetical protein